MFNEIAPQGVLRRSGDVMSCHVCHVHVMSCLSCTCVMSCHVCHVHVLSCHVMARRTRHDMTMPRWSHATARWSRAIPHSVCWSIVCLQLACLLLACLSISTEVMEQHAPGLGSGLCLGCGSGVGGIGRKPLNPPTPRRVGGF